MIYDIWLSELRYPLSRKREWLFMHKTSRNVHKALSDNKFLFETELDLENAKKIEEDCIKKGIHLHRLSEFGVPDYGELPLFLYCKGVIRSTSSSIGIVGARRCTSYGKRMTEELATACAVKGVTVVSGMAKGVDSIAHTAALKNGGYTIAALGNGPDICFPSEHRSLYEEIAQNGLIISEYHPGVHATQYTFPMRNRLIAAFSDKLVVTEAGLKSGSLITCERAKHYGKPVFAFPGPYDSPESEGCNKLIYEGAARLYRKEDVFEVPAQLSLPDIFAPVKAPLPAQPETRPASFSAGRSQPQAVVEYLRQHNGHAEFTEVAAALSVDMGRAYTLITEMELEDILKTEGENIWLQ